MMRLLVLSLLLSFIGCRQSATVLSEPSNELGDGIQTATMAQVGLDETVINSIIDDIDAGVYPNRHSLLIYKDDKLVVERYFKGKDENIFKGKIGVVNHNRNILHDIRSITKSIVSACIGIAIEQGKIKGVDQNVFDFFTEYEEYKTGLKKNLKIEHLLSMSSGMDWNEDVPYDNPANSEIQMTSSDDPLRFILSRTMVAPPGEEWKYNGGTTQLLAEILKRATGKKIDEFAEEYLFEPLGIQEYEWALFPGTDNPMAASGLRLTARDLLKFAILYQNEGLWKGKQIIPGNYVKRSFTSQVSNPDGGGYGYQFWIFNYTVGSKTYEVPTAVGNGDQRIFFDEANNLLVVTTAGNYNDWSIENNANRMMGAIYKALPGKEE